MTGPKSNTRVVVADDHPLFLKAIGQVFEDASGFEVVGSASSGLQSRARTSFGVLHRPEKRHGGLSFRWLAHPLLVLDALLGLGLLAVIGVAARRTPTSRSSTRKLAGCALVAGPLPLAVALHLFLELPVVLDQAAFVVGVVAFAIGAFLVISADDGEDRPELMDDLEPAPWWPDFERDFRAYARGRSLTRV